MFTARVRLTILVCYFIVLSIYLSVFSSLIYYFLLQYLFSEYFVFFGLSFHNLRDSEKTGHKTLSHSSLSHPFSHTIHKVFNYRKPLHPSQLDISNLTKLFERRLYNDIADTDLSRCAKLSDKLDQAVCQ